MRARRTPNAHNPLDDIAEILGEPADLMRNPANADYQCPYIDGTCTKISHRQTTPFPVCSVFRGRPGDPICVCPNRFLEADIQTDVLRECWFGPQPENPHIVSEVSMPRYGSVDFVIADLNAGNTRVLNFISVELQAVDITGTYHPSYEAIINNEPTLALKPTYGFNWANVRKRFISQIISKGFHHHHWGTKIVAIVQESLFDEVQKHAAIPSTTLAQASIMFLLYQFTQVEGRLKMELERVVPTTHSNVMMAELYETPPDRKKFEGRIIARLHDA